MLSVWEDAGWGELVKQGKYHDNRFADELVEAAAGMLQTWAPEPRPRWVVCVPSLGQPDLLPDFARRLADRLKLAYVPCLRKVRQNRPQKEMENSFQQAHNLDGAFELNSQLVRREPVLLLDDMVDSRWTIAVVSALLRRTGCPIVYPMALALTAPRQV